MEKLKLALVVVVLLLGVAVVYGYAHDSAEQPADSSVTAVESPPEATPPPGSASGAGDDASADDGTAPRPAPKDEGKSNKPRQASKDPAKPKPAEKEKDPDPSTPSESGPSEAKFVDRVEEICEELPRKFAERAQQVQGPGVKQEEILRRAAPPVLFAAARKLDKIGSPVGGEVDAGALVAALEKAAKMARDEPASGLADEDALLADFTTLAKRYGLSRCSRL